jgi:hypothetical protein
MAKKSKEKQPDAGAEKTAAAIREAFEAARKKVEEENRPKTYEDLMRYAADFPAVFPKNVSVSPLETAAPYYGEAAAKEMAAAAEYAAALNQLPQQKIAVDPAYYEQIKGQIPVKQSEIGSLYLPKQNIIGMMNPAANAGRTLSLTPEEMIANNYGNPKDLARSFLGSENLAKSFRDTLEHESFHALDPNVKFYAADTSDAGYMGGQGHLPTGLAKVQREQYAMTGKRFETPEKFKSFIIDLAKSKDPEEAMSGFTEEAKRSLRAQISNIRSVIPHLDDFKKYEEGGALRLFKGRRPYSGEQKKLDFLETSAQLIPALVEYRQASQQAT